jgi:hypothetical protein
MVTLTASIWIGFDTREAAAFAVARHSLCRHLSRDIPVHGLVLGDLQATGFYRRPMSRAFNRAGQPIMWDTISEAPQSTEHANARFLVPLLAQSDWALFMDGDMLVRDDLAPLFDSLDPTKALYCVPHEYLPIGDIKMDAQPQTKYARKNWSSFMIFNVHHPANAGLTLAEVNTRPGRDLHRFYWLEDDALIGRLPPEWNVLVGTTDPGIKPKVAHFTNGTPDMAGYHDAPYAQEWRDELAQWAGSPWLQYRGRLSVSATT